MVNGCIDTALLSKALYNFPHIHTHTQMAASYLSMLAWPSGAIWGSTSCPWGAGDWTASPVCISQSANIFDLCYASRATGLTRRLNMFEGWSERGNGRKHSGHSRMRIWGTKKKEKVVDCFIRLWHELWISFGSLNKRSVSSEQTKVVSAMFFQVECFLFFIDL